MNTMNKVCARCPASAGCKLVRGTADCRKSAARFGFNPKPRQIDRIQAMGVETLAHFLENSDELIVHVCERYCSLRKEDGSCSAEVQKDGCHKAMIKFLLSYVEEEENK